MGDSSFFMVISFLIVIFFFQLFLSAFAHAVHAELHHQKYHHEGAQHGEDFRRLFCFCLHGKTDAHSHHAPTREATSRLGLGFATTFSTTPICLARII